MLGSDGPIHADALIMDNLPLLWQHGTLPTLPFSLFLSLFPSLTSRLISKRDGKKVVTDSFDSATMPVVSRVMQKLIKPLLN